MADPISQLVHRHLDTTFPGAVVGVTHRGHTVYRRAFGARELHPVQKPMTLNTIFDLASLTKPLSTTLLTLMVFEQRGIPLDSPVGELLSDVPAETGKRTVRSLLAHTAGFPATPRLERAFTDPDRATRHEARRVIRAMSPQVPEGREVIYSCTGFVLLGELLEELTGRRLDLLFAEMIARPLHLEYLGYHPRDKHIRSDTMDRCETGANVAATEFCAWRKQWICGEVHDETAWCLGGVSGNAGLFGTLSSVQQLLNVLLCSLRSTSNSCNQLFSKDLLQQAVMVQTGGLPGTRGLGFQLGTPDNSAGPDLSDRAFGHTGFTGTSFWVDPDQELIVVALSNRVHLGRSATTRPLLEFRRSLNSLAVELVRGR
ncbi:MAG: serine hydrolase domain-containing protein [Alkalispirochaeta sp.]